MRIENRCPHDITLMRDDGTTFTIPPTKPAVRIKTNSGPAVSAVSGIPIHGPPRFNRIVNLPPQRDGIAIVVSQIAALAISALHPDRADVFYPGTAPEDGAQRQEDGTRRILCVKRLIQAS